ncbi:MAG: hypothetical protein ACREBW_00720 [Candidatus Micrarchaeaceae archaeon]
MNDHQIGLFALAVSTASLVFAAAAILISLYAIRRGNKNASAAMLVTLTDGLRQAWYRFITADTEAAQSYQLAELMNLAEIASAIHFERSLVGVSRELIVEYLDNSLSLLKKHPKARAQVTALRHSAETFKYIDAFIKSRSNISGLFENVERGTNSNPRPCDCHRSS